MNMDQKILNELQSIKKILATVVTKADAKNFITKDDLKNELATYPNKDDLRQELAKFLTKDDLNDALEKQAEDFGSVVSELFAKIDERKADRADVKALEHRVTLSERKIVV